MESPLASAHVTDLALAQRLERVEGSANAAFVESRARSAPAIGAELRDVGGTYAMFDGVGSPITQTFGFGLFSAPTHGQLDEIEAFFRERGSEVFQEVSPLAAPEVLTLLPERGYRPIELTSVMHMRLTGDRPAAQRRSSAELTVRRIDPGEEPVWAETAARGWGDIPGLGELVLDLGRVSAGSRGTVCFSGRVERRAHWGCGGGAAWRRRGARGCQHGARVSRPRRAGRATRRPPGVRGVCRLRSRDDGSVAG